MGLGSVRPLTWLVPAILTAQIIWGAQANAIAKAPEPLPSYARAVALREDASLLAVAFADRQHGIACGDRGTILTTADGGASWTLRSAPVDCSLRDVVWISHDEALVVGGGYDMITRLTRGVVLFSRDRGQSWEPLPHQDLPALRSVEVLPNGTVMAAGDWSDALWSNRFESRDGGRNWQVAGRQPLDSSSSGGFRDPERLQRWAQAIGAPIAVQDVCRVGEHRLCAVGDHGTVAITEINADGGERWSVVRGLGRSAAVLVLARRPDTVPWSLVGREALEHRGRVGVLVGTVDATSLAITRQAAIMLGAAGADRVSASEAGFTAAAQRWIEIHRPAVLLMDHGLDAEVRDAVSAAAAEWGVCRVASYSPFGADAAGRRDALLHHSGVLISDLSTDARLLVAPEHLRDSLPHLNYLYDTASANRQSQSLIADLKLRPGQRLDAPLDPASRRQLQILQARLAQSANLFHLLNHNSTGNPFGESLTAILDQTAGEDRLRLAWRVLHPLWQAAGDVQPAAERTTAVLDEIGRRFAGRSIANWAQLRLTAIAGSAEWQRLWSQRVATPPARPGGQSETVAVSPFQVTPGAVRQASLVTPVLVAEAAPITWADHQSPTAPPVDLAWELHPLMVLQRAAQRRRGEDGQLQVVQPESTELQRLAQAGPAAWRHLVATQLPNRVIATAVGNRPRLDGHLNDPCWNPPALAADQLPASAARLLTGPRLKMAFDADYVYLAAHVPADWMGDSNSTSATSGGRDQDLQSLDRVQLRIDIDRDLVTSMSFEFHDLGGTRDSIDGVIQWQPTWYLATHRQQDEVTIELAILRRDLVELPITRGDSWFVSLRPLPSGQPTMQPAMPDPGDWIRVDFH